jgi:hypothetical protein
VFLGKLGHSRFRGNRLSGDNSVFDDHLQQQAAGSTEPIVFDQTLGFGVIGRSDNLFYLEYPALMEVTELGTAGWVQTMGEHDILQPTTVIPAGFR